MDLEFRESINDKETYYHWINVKGREFEEKGNIEMAIKVYEKGLEEDTDTPATWNSLFNIYKDRRDIRNMERVMKYGYEKEKGSKYREKNLKRKKSIIEDIRKDVQE